MVIKRAATKQKKEACDTYNMANINCSPVICSKYFPSRPVFSRSRPVFLSRPRPAGQVTSCLPHPIEPLTFAVRRHMPELIAPATPTPPEVKTLSDIDDQVDFRTLTQFIHFYRRNPNIRDKDPASVIRDALAKLLVFYYPLAGRLKEGPGGKLMVDCTGEGVLYIEAEADVTLEQFGTLHPPFPCVEKLFCHVHGSGDILGSPLVQIQVTRLLCGGFIFTSRIYHNMCDGAGTRQFLMALGEMSRGALEPSVLPIWQRELLNARDPPRVTFPHPEYNDVVDTTHNIVKTNEMVDKSFFFGPVEMLALRRFVPENYKTCTTFEVLTACIWRCRMIALQANPEQDTRLMIFVNGREKFNPPIPVGYYGNCIVVPCVVSKVGDLCNKSFRYALELVMKAKSNVTEEYVRSTADLMVIKGRPHFKVDQLTYIVSTITRIGLNNVNFGWGEAIYAGFPKDDEDFPGIFSGYMPYTNDNGESGIVVDICLPVKAMEKFVEELNVMLR